ncbi:MAG: DUF1016 domain-containing protein [Lachnospiraceae bacterium]|nr:DUF1016 domain-containing protein [Lachnospiraceae bacterium]
MYTLFYTPLLLSLAIFRSELFLSNSTLGFPLYPPIGIVLCADKSDTLVEYTLPEDNKQIFAAKYLPYMPTKDELKRDLI